MLYFLAFVIALGITTVLIPVLARLAPVVGLTDRPSPRKVHSHPVPRIGGIAMALGMLAPAYLLITPSPQLRGLLLGIVTLLIFGVWDDRVELNYAVKFLGQVLAVLLCIGIGGIHIETFTFANQVIVLPAFASWGLTFVFLVGVTNAVNLTDGLDGLAGGLALLCFCALALLAAASHNAIVVTFALIETGAILGFLRFNTHPARVFMGDSGSQVLGFTIGMLAIFATQSETAAVSAALPLLLVGMPIIDTLTVMLHRIRHGRSPFTSDRNHLHHRLLALGFTHREAVIILYLLQVSLFLLAYFLRFESDVAVFGVFCAFAGVLLGLMHRAGVTGWRAHGTGVPASQSRWSRRVRGSLPAVSVASVWTMGFCACAYALSIVLSSAHVSSDVTALCLVLLVPLLVAALSRSEGPAGWLERTVAYVGVVLLVYLDETTSTRSGAQSGISWVLLGLTGAAALARFWLSPVRRFQLTSLDVLVMFIALVIPHLPGAETFPPALSAGIAKAVILLYVVEMLLAFEVKARLPRFLLALVLTGIAARGLLLPT